MRHSLTTSTDSEMITSKAQMLKIIATCAQPHTLTREEKFQVFVNVCDNMLAEGRLSKANHKRWTNVF
jgi:elongation factor P--beta-lysine ligase